MSQQTPTKPVLFRRTLTQVVIGVFSVVLSVLATTVITTPRQASAATQSTINFQARLEGAGGNIAPDGLYNVRFKIYNALSGGSQLWTEDYIDTNGASAGQDYRVQVTNGYLSVPLGSQSAFSGINWDQQVFITMTVGGTNQVTPSWDTEMSPRLAMTGVPYAFKAGALSTTSGSYTSTLSINSPTGGNQTFQLLDQGAGGTYTLLTNTNGVQLQGTTPGSAQTGNFNVTGTGIAGTALKTPSLDVASAGALTIGNGTATSINIGNQTSNILTTVYGRTIVKPTTGNDSATAFQVQNAAGANWLNVDTTTGTVSAGTVTISHYASGDTSSLFDNGTVPGSASDDGGTLNLGVKFTSDLPGVITGIKFYNPSGNNSGGTDIGKLWACNAADCDLSSGGTQLATVTFSADSSVGWKQATFSSPVAISADTYYIATYYTATAQYYGDSDYFASSLDNAPLHAPADSIVPNGVYAINSTGFPDSQYQESNYWVDVMFQASADMDTISSDLPLSIVSNDKLTLGSNSHDTDLLGDNVKIQGNIIAKPLTDSTAAFQIQNAAGDELFGVDSSVNVLRLLNSSGETPAWTNNSNDLPDGRNGHGSVTANGYVYVVGGIDTSYDAADDVYYARVNADGSIGTWASTTSLPTVRHNLSAVTANGYIYVLGGADDTNTHTSVFYAKLNPDGTVGAWNSTTALPWARKAHSSVVANGYVYAIGGRSSGGSPQDDVQYAKLNPDGTIGAWNDATDLDDTIENQESVVANGYLYNVGGSIGGAASDEVSYAKLNSDGTTGSWSTTNALPDTEVIHAAVVLNGYIYSVGGANGADDNYAFVSYAHLNADGTVGTWTQTTNMNIGRRDHTAVTVNGRIYAIGGDHGTGPLDSLEYVSPARVTVGGGLDLVSLSGGSLAEGGSGGHLTAGNTFVSGTLTATDAVNFLNSASIEGDLRVGASALFKNAVNSSTAFRIQNASGNNVLNVDTAGSQVTLTGQTDDTQLVIKSFVTQSMNKPQVLIQNSDGTERLRINATSDFDLLMGYHAGASLDGTGDGANTAFGVNALASSVDGSGNVAVGFESMFLADGSDNVGIGYGASGNIVGNDNVAIGKSALGTAEYSWGNVAIGAGAGNVAAGGATFYDNVFLGKSAGYYDLNNFFLQPNDIHNSVALGAQSVVQADNSIVLGSVDNPTKVGIGTTIPDNMFSVSPKVYDTGTAAQSTTTITGTGTSWSEANGVRPGQRFIYADGTDGGTIVSVNSTTSLTVTSSQTVTPAQHYRIHTPGFNVTSAGNTYIQTGSTNAFAVQNAAGTNLLSTDTINLDVAFTGRANITKSSATTTEWSKVSNVPGTVDLGGTADIDAIRSSVVFDGSLYVGTEESGSAEIYRYDGGTGWTKVSHSTPGTMTSGGTSSIDSVISMAVVDGELYAGTLEAGDAEVYRYDGGTTWTRISQATNGQIASGGTSGIDAIHSLVNVNGTLFAGTEDAGNAEVYRFDGGTTWTKVSDATPGKITSSGTSGIDAIAEMTVLDSTLFIGTAKTGQAEVYRYDGSGAWTKVSDATAGKITSSGTSSIDGVYGMAVYNGSLYAGTTRSDKGEVYRYDGGGAWTKVSQATAGIIASGGIDDIDGVPALTVYNGALYVGTYTSTSEGEIYRYDGGTSWTQVSQPTSGTIGSAAGSYSGIDEIYTLTPHASNLYAGTWEGGNAEIYRYSDNLLSVSTSDEAGVVSVSNSGTAIFQNSTDSTTAFQVQNASGLALLNVDTLNTKITVSADLNIEAGKSLTVTGGTAFPGSPVEGQIFYRSDTDQLYIYTGGKWQADRSTATKIVAASDSQNKEKADYVADGTNDEVEIEAAITALPSTGGKIVLLDGEFGIGSEIDITKDNVTITGSGNSTLLDKEWDQTSFSGGLITVSAHQVTLSEMKLYGFAGGFPGFENVGIYVGTGEENTTVNSVWIDNFGGSGIVVDSNNTTHMHHHFTNNLITDNVDNGMQLDSIRESVISHNTISLSNNYGIYLDGSLDNSITGNVISTNDVGIFMTGSTGTAISGNVLKDNTVTGLRMSGNSNNVTGNVINGNVDGIFIANGTGESTISGNTINSNTDDGIVVDSGSVTGGISVNDNNISYNANSAIELTSTSEDFNISGNTMYNNTGSGSESNIEVNDGDNNQVVGNKIIDTGGTGFAILIGSGGTGNYVADNTYSGAGATSISDASTSTKYANQLTSTGILMSGAAGQLIKPTANTATAFQVQNAAAASLFNVDTLDSNITLLGNNSGEPRVWSTGTAINNGTACNSSNNRDNATGLAYGGYLYVVGGDNGTMCSTIMYSKINADGSNGTWTNNSTTLNTAVNYSQAVVANGYMYVIAGSTNAAGSTKTAIVQYAKINTDGSLGTFTTTTSIPTALVQHKAASYGGYIYVLGGNTNTVGSPAESRHVYYAKAFPDGTVGAWTTVSNALISPGYSESAVAVANGYVYLVGGTGSSLENDVTYAKFDNDADGGLGSFTNTGDALPANLQSPGAAVMNGYLYVVGGATSGTPGQTVYYAALGSTGALGAFSTASTSPDHRLPAARMTFVSAQANGYIYAIGGWNGSAAQSTTYYTSLPRLTVGGSLDLIGLSGENLAEGGSGGTLTAGNTRVVGTLQVSDTASFLSSATIEGDLRVGASALFKNGANSTTAFQIQNASAVSMFTVDTTNARLYVGPTAGDTVGTILVLGKKTNSGDPTGVEGATYFNSSYQRMRCYYDSKWRFCNDPVGLTWGYDMKEDFLGDPAGSFGEFMWAVDDVSGTGAWSQSVQPDVYYRPGQVQLETGTTTTGYANIYQDDNELNFFIGGGEELEMAINIPTLATGGEDYIIRVGLCDNNPTASGDCGNGVYFEYDRSTSANWRYATAKASTRTKTSSSTAVATGWVRLKAVVNSAGTSVEFFVNGTSVGTSSSNIPDTTSNFAEPSFTIKKTAGTTNRTMKIDYFQLRNTLTTPR